ncbi:MAG: ribosome assembly factor SBDS, partial [Candidatus Aenigmarchaeota archaeon]|nr:ribosome assembly factor SBDS [Candidatus Aenigmarchaeota archaeon]
MGVSVDKAVIAKITKGGEKFEILVDPVKALEVKMGKDIEVDELVVSREIYEDTKKGTRAPQDKVNKAFGTNNIKDIVYKIIRQGEVQLTTEQ